MLYLDGKSKEKAQSDSYKQYIADTLRLIAKNTGYYPSARYGEKPKEEMTMEQAAGEAERILRKAGVSIGFA